MDAFAHLGLRPDADERAVKRAYAQRLRQVRPDVDPVGFQALHEAYQAALACFRATTTAAEAVDADLGNDDRPTPTPAAVARAVEPPVETQRDPLVEATSPPAFDFDAFYVEMLAHAGPTHADDLSHWLLAHPAFQSIEMKSSIGAMTLDRVLADDPDLTPEQLDVLIEFFGFDDVLARLRPSSVQGLQAYLERRRDAHAASSKLPFQFQLRPMYLVWLVCMAIYLLVKAGSR